MYLKWLGRAVWQVVAVADDRGLSLDQELRSLGRSDSSAEAMLATLEEIVPLHGPPVHNKTKCRPLGNDIFEFKVGRLRVLWFYDAGEPVIRRLIVCSHLFLKQSRKTPRREIDKAAVTREAYLEAKRRGDLKVALGD